MIHATFEPLLKAPTAETVRPTSGTTNRAFLLDLLHHPDVQEGRIDTGWLDRLTGGAGWRYDHRAEVALASAAIEAYDAASDIERARFFASAARGRPQASPEVKRTVDLRYGGSAYRLQVACTGPNRYRVEVDGYNLVARIEPLRPFERRVLIGEHRHRVVLIA